MLGMVPTDGLFYRFFAGYYTDDWVKASSTLTCDHQKDARALDWLCNASHSLAGCAQAHGVAVDNKQDGWGDTLSLTLVWGVQSDGGPLARLVPAGAVPTGIMNVGLCEKVERGVYIRHEDRPSPFNGREVTTVSVITLTGTHSEGLCLGFPPLTPQVPVAAPSAEKGPRRVHILRGATRTRSVIAAMQR